ncbi:histidine phosphatase family protein [Sphaerisporangium fuscum]|uniref:histidine phosphatase family protein n=1 Tax=Sphaerisporangium fuscum TaxID=2835868 RepID=UPI0027E23CD7|nr:histidine phosphatase family protein [Sphaerisporangium fuscum]
MTVRIVMVCHGSTDALQQSAFPSDEGLDARGRREAAGAGHLFAHFPTLASRRGESASPGTAPPRPAVLCGPSARCLQTASGLGLDATPDDGLRDCDFGRWAGRTLTDVQADDPDGLAAWLADPAAAPHGGESVIALIGRVATWLRARSDQGGRLLAITHPAVMRAAAVHAVGAPAEAFWNIDVEPLSQLSLTAHGARWRLRFPGPSSPALHA